MLLLFTLSSLLRLDILIWVAGVPLLLIGLLLLVIQQRQARQLDVDLEQMKKMKRHSIEYDLVLKAMKLCVWHLDVQSHLVTLETDYRDKPNSLCPQPDTKLEDVCALMSPDDAGKIAKGMEDLMAGRLDEQRLQYRIKPPGSSAAYWSEGYATIDKRGMDGKPLTIVGTSMRIDDQKEIERELIEARNKAEESDRLKSAFLTNMSHEIRTPLNAIVGFSEVLQEVQDEAERANLVRLIQENNDHLLRLFDDMANMSRLEAGSGAVRKTRFPLSVLFRELADKYAVAARKKGLAIVVEDEGNAPDLYTDRERLAEILNQLMSNAVKFTEQGSITLGGEATDDEMLRIWVRDTGKGIPEDQCNDHLFERFVKVDEFVAGTGLGLAISRSLAQSLGGRVGVTSVPGEGSCFWVELPVG